MNSMFSKTMVFSQNSHHEYKLWAESVTAPLFRFRGFVTESIGAAKDAPLPKEAAYRRRQRTGSYSFTNLQMALLSMASQLQTVIRTKTSIYLV